MVLLIVVAVVVALAAFTDAISKIVTFFKSLVP